MLQNPVGEIVKNFRKHNAYSQEEFAGISGVATRTLQRLESGEKANVETLRAIAAALKMDVKELVLLNEPIDAAEFAKVQEAIREQAKEVEKEISTLPRILNGKELLDVVSSFDLLNTDYPPPATHEEGTVVAELLEMVRDYGDIHGELPPTQDMEMVFEASRCLKRLEDFNLVVFGGKLRGSVVFPHANKEMQPARMNYGGLFIRRAGESKTFNDPNNGDRESARFRIPFGPVSLS